jgi:hypothetical protein
MTERKINKMPTKVLKYKIKQCVLIISDKLTPNLDTKLCPTPQVCVLNSESNHPAFPLVFFLKALIILSNVI